MENAEARLLTTPAVCSMFAKNRGPSHENAPHQTLDRREIEVALGSGDLVTVQRLAHGMKAGAANFGGRRLARIIHQAPTTTPQLPASTALRSVGLLDVLPDTPAVALGLGVPVGRLVATGICDVSLRTLVNNAG